MMMLERITRPPIVGVPCFFRCVCGPSSRTCCPNFNLWRNGITIGHSTALTTNAMITASIFAYYIVTSPDIGTGMLIPFTGKYLQLPVWLFVPALFFIILGTDNGVNFTDGLDGLCTSVTIMVATFFTIVAIGENSGISPITGAVVGSLLGFLLFNVYPARVFMGDTGSLALGGFVASSAFMMQMPIFIAIVGLIYLVEVLSVIIQVTYFKKTGGKRFFKMAPIHHHFELCGWSETRVVGVFSIITAILCLIAYLGL